MQLAITNPNGPLTMTSLEIAELVKSRHDDVKRSIVRLAERGVISLPPMAEVKVQRERRDETISVYLVCKRDSFIIVAQLSPEFTAGLVDRWQELEGLAADPMRALGDPATMRKLLLGYTEHVLKLEGQVAELAPKAVALDRISKATFGATCIREAAKAVDERPKQFFHQLHSWGWIFPQRGGGWSAYSDRLAAGDLELKTTTIERTDGTSKCVHQVLVTPQGLAKLAMKLGKPGPTAPLFQ